MEKIYDKKKIAASIANSKYHALLDTLPLDFYLIKYEKGEFVSSPFRNESLFQIVEQGSVNIYFIRDDGTRYSLSSAAADYLLGDMDIFYNQDSNIYLPKPAKPWPVSYFRSKNTEKSCSPTPDFSNLSAAALRPKSEP